jgi:phage FluMu protein Com
MHQEGGHKMQKLSNRISYLHGLAEGMGLGNSKEGRIIHEMIHVLKDMAGEMHRMANRMEEQDEYLEAIDEDLSDVEDYVETIDEDLSEVEDVLYVGEDNEGLDAENEWIYFDDEDEEGEVLRVDETYDEMAYDDDDSGYFEIECPNCQELVAVDQDIFDDDTVAEVLCPECHEVILINDDIEEMDEVDHDYRMERHR